VTTRAVGTLVFCFLGLVGVQFIRPPIQHPSTRVEASVPTEATGILRTSCYSCHSNEQRLAWFDEIVPGYWMVRRDIIDARVHLNFSTLGAKPPEAQRAALFEAVNMASLGAMPLKSFSLLHPEARVKQADLGRLKAYLDPWHDLPARAPNPSLQALPDVVEPMASGVRFDPQFTHWHLLSITDRGDNHSLRAILGNDVAMQAARVGAASPWPDGARFAKVAWKQRLDSDGTIRPGQFIQIELMVKDAKVYRGSDGWGWGRWKGLAFQPYGNSPQVAAECTGCHAPMKRNDFVYTMPISVPFSRNDQFNERAAVMPVLPFDPFAASLVSLSVDRSRSTISALFSHSSTRRELLLITWSERDDPHWFGARIPGDFLTAEYVGSTRGAPSVYIRFSKNAAGERRTDTPSLNRANVIERLEIAPYLSY